MFEDPSCFQAAEVSIGPQYMSSKIKLRRNGIGVGVT